MKIFQRENWHKIELFTLFFIVFIAGISAGYAWRMYHERPAYRITWTVDGNTHKLLTDGEKFHGIRPDEPVLSDPLGWYFIRDGKRCPF